MVRTQVQTREEQAAILRTMSAERRRPVSELIRMSIDSFLQREAGVSGDCKRATAKSAHISAEHDRYLAEAIGR
jgi:hypothetical protein